MLPDILRVPLRVRVRVRARREFFNVNDARVRVRAVVTLRVPPSEATANTLGLDLGQAGSVD